MKQVNKIVKNQINGIYKTSLKLLIGLSINTKLNRNSECPNTWGTNWGDRRKENC